MRALSNGIITFKKHILTNTAGNIGIGCIGSPRSRVCRGDGRLCNVCFTGRTVIGRSHYFLIRNCASIVSVRRSNVRGIITSSNATLASKRVQVVRHFAGGVAILCSNSTTNVGTSVQNVSVLLRRNVGIGIYLLPSNSSPSSFTHGRGTARFRTFVRRGRASFVHFGAGLLLRSTKGSPVGHTRLVKGLIRDVSVVPRTVIHSICVGRYTRLLRMRSGLLISRITGHHRGRTRRRTRQTRHRHQSTGTTETGTRAKIGNDRATTAGPSTRRTNCPSRSLPTNLPSRAPPPFPPRRRCMSFVPRRNGRNRRFCGCRQLVLGVMILCNRQIVYGIAGRRKRRAPVAMARCVIGSLGRSRLTFRGPLRQRVLARTTRHVRGRNFATRQCFITRPSPIVDGLDIRLVDGHCRLEGSRVRRVMASRRHLCRLVPQLVVGFGCTVIYRRLGRALFTLRGPTVTGSRARYGDVVRHCGRLGGMGDVVTGQLKSEIVLGFWVRFKRFSIGGCT